MELHPDVLERLKENERARNSTFFVTYSTYSGDDLLEFHDGYRTEGEMDGAKRYWWNQWGFQDIKTEDLWPGETKLARTRRLRNNKKWEQWRE